MGELKLPTEDEPAVVIHGDAVEAMRSLAPDDVGHVITDPPFGVRADEWDDMPADEFARFSMGWMSEARRLTSSLVVFCTAGNAIERLCEMLYPRVRRMVWNKPSGSQYAGASECGMWFAHETILHCHAGMSPKGRATATLLREARQRAGLSLGAVDIAIRGKKTGLAYRWEEAACLPTARQCDMLKGLLGLDGNLDAAILADRESLCDSAAKSDVFTHRTVTEGAHPCEKPVRLMADLIECVTEPGDVVLDPFMGVGTTGRACIITGRRFIGVEQDEGYHAIARKRIWDAQGVGGLYAPSATPLW